MTKRFSISKHLFKLIAISFFYSITINSQNNSDAIIGVWETEDKDGKIQIYKDNNTFSGKLLWGKDVFNKDGSPKKDIQNPDEKLRSKNIVDSTILKNLTFNGKEYEKGKIYNSVNGKTYKCYVWIKNDILYLRGYLGLKMLGQTTKWNRIK